MRHRLAIVLVALWIGALVTVCALVAPTLFAVLPDRHAAGTVAATLFRFMAWAGLGFAVAVFALRARESRPIQTAALVVAAASPLVSELALQPLMHAAQAAGQSGRFVALHAIAGILFVVACLAGLALLWQLTRREA